MYIFLKNIADFKDQEVTIKGWVYNLRSSGRIAFLQIRDGGGFIQVIIEKSGVSEDVWEQTKKITLESSVVVTGKVTPHPKQSDVFELQVSNLETIQLADEYPIGKKEHGPEFLLDKRHLWLRSNKQWAIQRVRNTVINAIYEYLNNQGFIKIDSPILTPTSCEGTTTLFEVPYFDLGSAYLSQSGQLYIEAAIFSHGRVFDFGPVFRAEKSKTRRHLTEFWMMDAEAAFVEHEENMQIQEQLISFVATQVVENNQSELAILERDIEPLKKIKPPFLRITHAEAVKKLQSLGSDIKDKEDLGGDDETLLTKGSSLPVFVEKWPKEIKAFYMRRDLKNSDLVLGADLIAPEGFGEIIGGSERETDYDVLIERMKEENLPIEPFQWYLDLRKYGSVPHSGFGIGLERLVGWMCGTHHIRETIPFPRMINRLTP
jgi:asparaginyl-tRNA synthetase